MVTTTATPPATGSRPTAPGRDVLKLPAAAAGALAAGVALGVGEFVAGLVRDTPSPVVAVGDMVIDLTPGDLARGAISVFGSNDKPALVIGTVVIALFVGARVGVAAAGRRWKGDVAMVVAGLVGAVAAIRFPGHGSAALLPLLCAVPAGATTLRTLLYLAPRSSRAREAPSRPAMGIGVADRRVFLGFAATAAASAAVLAAGGRKLRDQFSADKARSEVVLGRAAEPAPPLPDGVEVGVDGVTPFVTPNDRFYRIDTALTVPQVDPSGWKLSVSGLVDGPFEIGYDELMAMDLVETDITISCVSNEIGGGLIGNARWLGVPVAALLDRAGVDPSADQLVGRSVDGYTCGFPVELARDRDALVAVGMNGEPLPVAHGFPARLVTPGLYGYTSATKWLAELELSRFDDFDQYWVRRGWAEFAPVKTQCRIDTPDRRTAAGTVPVAGIAWAPHVGIDAVEVSIDDGPWEPARLGAVPGIDTWRQWVYEWKATPGRHVIWARATDATGRTQTDKRTQPFPSGATGYPRRAVDIT